MPKIIVTHSNPDLDAIAAVWLVLKYWPEFSQAEVEFVPAGGTLNNQTVDSDPNVIHVDTGLGKFDHHQLEQKTCASELVFNYSKSIKPELKSDRALVRLIKLICELDHFGECNWPEPESDRYNIGLDDILNGLKAYGYLDDNGLISFGGHCLDGIHTSLKIKIRAEEDLKKGYLFSSKWGKAIGCLTRNDQVIKLGQKLGYVVVAQKDPETEQVRIKARPDSKADLTEVKNKLAKLDPRATWFLHISKKMLLNGSSKNKNMKPSKLSLTKVIKVLEDT